MEDTGKTYRAWGIDRGVHEASGLKPMLSPDELVSLLKSKGVCFKRCDEQTAIEALTRRDTFLHVASYRKLFQVHQEGKNAGRYVNLDFADLLYLDNLDYAIRRAFLAVANDVERTAKTLLVAKIVDESGEDGYSIVADFMQAQPRSYRNSIARNLAARAESSESSDVYTGELIEHYRSAMPTWVFLEVVPFGTLLAFMLFCATRWDDKRLKASHYRLTYVKAIRNCCSHMSCILNGFDDGCKSPYTAPYSVQAWLSDNGIKKSRTRKTKMQNRRMQQLVTALCVYGTEDTERSPYADSELDELSDALREAVLKYGNQNAFVSYLSFLAEVIDKARRF